MLIRCCWLPSGARQFVASSWQPYTALPTHLSQVLHGEGLDALAALGELLCLQRCLLERTDKRAADEAVPALPGGPWLRSLRMLGANIDVLSSSTAVLQAAPALEVVCAGDTDSQQQFDWRSPAAAAFFDWLARHPPLRLVYFEPDAESAAFDSHLFAARLAQLWRRRPGMDVQCWGFEDVLGIF